MKSVVGSKGNSMKTNRRDFLRCAALAGSTSTLMSSRLAQGARPRHDLYAALDRELQKPVLKRELFPLPVMIESVELLRDRDNFICRVRSKDGAEGVSIGHPFIARHSYPLFVNRLVPFFVGKDANGTLIPVEGKAEKFESIKGEIKVPSGSGLGVRIDPGYIKTHKRFTG